MFKRIVATLAIASVAWAEAEQANMTVYTRTGTFVGGLNDTYLDVRHFKYVPYAKVCSKNTVVACKKLILNPFFLPASGGFSTLDFATTSRQFFRGHRLDGFWPRVLAIRFGHPYCLGHEHHRQSCR